MYNKIKTHFKNNLLTVFITILINIIGIKTFCKLKLHLVEDFKRLKYKGKYIEDYKNIKHRSL